MVEVVPSLVTTPVLELITTWAAAGMAAKSNAAAPRSTGPLSLLRRAFEAAPTPDCFLWGRNWRIMGASHVCLHCKQKIDPFRQKWQTGCGQDAPRRTTG